MKVEKRENISSGPVSSSPTEVSLFWLFHAPTCLYFTHTHRMRSLATLLECYSFYHPPALSYNRVRANMFPPRYMKPTSTSFWTVTHAAWHTLRKVLPSSAYISSETPTIGYSWWGEVHHSSHHENMALCDIYNIVRIWNHNLQTTG